MTKRILIVDRDTGFSTILSETLNNHPAFEAIAVPSSTEAMEHVVENALDLVVVDMGLTDISPVKLIAAIREYDPDMAVMVIPLMGKTVPADVEALGIQGVLTKPFFVGDLPKLVGAAVGLALDGEEPPPPKPVETDEPVRRRPKLAPPKPRSRRPGRSWGLKPSNYQTPPRRGTRSRSQPQPSAAPAEIPSWQLEQLHKHTDEIIKRLDLLNSEVGAEVILLTVGSALIAKAGNMPDDRAETLASLVAAAAQAAAQAAAFLGERDGWFEQSLHEGSQYRLYAYSLGQGAVLSMALGTNLPLGMVRHQTKMAARDLMKFIK